MGLADAFGKDDRIELKVASFIDMVERTTKAEALAGLMMNGIKCDVPHIFLREVMTGEKEEIEHPFADMLLDMLAGDDDDEEEAPEEEEPNDQPAPLQEVDDQMVGEAIERIQQKKAKATIKDPARWQLPKAPNTVKVQRGMELAKEGKTYKEIMEEVGCTEVTARRYVAKAHEQMEGPDEETEETEQTTV